MRTVVGDDAVGDAKAADDALAELDGRARRNGSDRFYFCPLGELVDGNVEVVVAPCRARERAQYVQTPDCEGRREGNGLEPLSQLRDFLGVELAGLAGPDELRGILKRGGPVEIVTEYLARESA